jgi:threonine/homoserine/homoserine lactone efflux protein
MMADLSTLLVFVLAAVVLVIIPGPNVLYISARSIHQGRAAGLVSSVGIETATIVHVALATAGVSAVLAASAAAFSVVKYAGAAYLVFLGIRTLLSRDTHAEVDAPPTINLRRVYWQGFVVNLLNPKTALFFLAFLPQFVQPDRGPVAIQTLVLGLVLMTIGMGNNVAWALVAGRLGAVLRRNGRGSRVERWLTGGVYIGLGALTAFSGGHARD